MDLLTDIEYKLIGFIEQEIIQAPDLNITNQTSLINGGLIDSYSLVNLSLYIENTFKIRISDEEITIDNFDTVAKMAKMIKTKL